MKLVLEIILALGLLNAILIDKALTILSAKELKRRARGHDPDAAAIYKMAAYGKSLSLMLWLKGVACATWLFLIVFSHSWVAALVFAAVVAWLVRVWQPATTGGIAWRWAGMVAPLIARIIGYLQPLLSRLEGLAHSHTQRSNVYEEEDLVELLETIAKNPENRIAHEDLQIAAGALMFGQKTVGLAMTPLRSVRIVGEDEVVGPLLMDELHESGFSRFPVKKAGGDKAHPQIIGTLYIKELISYTGSGKVSTVMDKKVYYANEAASLRSALDAFIKTHHHLFVVVNNFEEVVGVISIEDVLEQIIGKQIVDEFDRYDDLRAVAAHEAEKERQKHNDQTVAPEAD